jgi:hypothetical protein
VRAASRAPDHQCLKPFRLLVINPNEREAMADVFEAAELELDPSIGGERLERARENALHAPILLAVISRLQKSDEVPEIEQRVNQRRMLTLEPTATKRMTLLVHSRRRRGHHRCRS